MFSCDNNHAATCPTGRIQQLQPQLGGGSGTSRALPSNLWPHDFRSLSIILAIFLGVFDFLTLPLTGIAIFFATLVSFNYMAAIHFVICREVVFLWGPLIIRCSTHCMTLFHRVRPTLKLVTMKLQSTYPKEW